MTRVGFVGDGAEAAVEGVEDAGGHGVAGSAAAVVESDADVLVALGEDALTDLVAAGATRPVLPVDAGRGAESVPRTALDGALHALVAAEYETRPAAVFDVTAGRESYRAFADVTLVTTEAARISEYGIRTEYGDDAATVDTVRADGVVVATPRGSHGYASDARGPLLAPNARAASVVPVAPFRIDKTHWVLSPPVTLTVERDESDVTLLVDDEDHGVLDTDTAVTLDWGDPVPLVHLPQSTPYFD